MAATLRAGEPSAISHDSATHAWGMLPFAEGPIDISVPRGRQPRDPRLRVHRRSVFAPSQVARRSGIAITTPALTLVDIAPRISPRQLERAVEKTVGTGHWTPGSLRRHLDGLPRLPGRKILRSLLDRDEFVLTDTELERLFVPIALSAGLPPPQTQVHLSGHRVDFFWPGLSLVVETDSLRWHRTAAAQARDLRRDQDHARAGLLVLRFSHFQIRYERETVCQTLTDVAARRQAHMRAA